MVSLTVKHGVNNNWYLPKIINHQNCLSVSPLHARIIKCFCKDHTFTWSFHGIQENQNRELLMITVSDKQTDQIPSVAFLRYAIQ